MGRRDRLNYNNRREDNRSNFNEVRELYKGYRSAFDRNRRRYLDGEDVGNDKKENRYDSKPDRRDPERKPMTNKRRTFGFSDDEAPKRPDFMEGAIDVELSIEKKEPEIVHVEEYDYMEDFLDEYLSDEVKTNFSKQKEAIYDHILDIAGIISHYFNPKYRDIVPEMDLVLQVMVTDSFARAFYNVLVNAIREQDDPDEKFANWEEDYEVVGMMVAVLLGTRRHEMTEETEALYMTKVAKGIWNEEIRQLTNATHITEELATDLILRTPVTPDKMKDYHIEMFYKGFLDSMLLHADDNIEVLDRNTQRKIFHFIYGKGKNAAKVIGRNLSDPVRDGLESVEKMVCEKMVYTEFRSMLYEALDGFDIGIIKFVLKFIVNQKKMNPSAKIVFDFNTAVDYPNINRALQLYIGEDKDAKDCLNL